MEETVVVIVGVVLVSCVLKKTMAATAVSRIFEVACLTVLAGICLASSEQLEGGNDTFSVSVLSHGVYGGNKRHIFTHDTQRHVIERVRRQAPINKNKRGYNEQEKRAFLDKHNALRRLAPASDMNYLVWDDDLEALAQKWAENCVFKHRPDRQNIGKYSYAGENVYAGTGSYDPDHVAKLWYDEVSMYSYSSVSCSGVCGHYTQIVWAASRAVGCGVFYCHSLARVNFKKGFLVVCNYGPGGNYVGQRPYKKGAPASQCEDDAIFDIDGLCSQYPVIEAADGAAVPGPAFSITGFLLSWFVFYSGFLF